MFFTKNLIHAHPDSRISEARVDPIVIKKEYTFASPILKHSVDQLQREPFVPPWINKIKSWNKHLLRKSVCYVNTDFSIKKLRLIAKCCDPWQSSAGSL